MHAIYLVRSNCSDPSRHDEFNKWYDDVHIPHVLRAPGMVGAKRYRLATKGANEAQYLAIYEMDTPDPEQVLTDIRAQSAGLRERGEWIDCIEVISTALYDQL